MPAVVLFIIYALLLAWIIYRRALRTTNCPSPHILVSAFAFKVLMGCVYGMVFLHFYGGDDTWMYHRESLAEYQLMIHHPGQFLKELLPFHSFEVAHSFTEGMHIYIMDLENQALTKLLAVFNILSRGNYYINVLFFDFILFAGPVWLYKLIHPYFPGKKKLLTLVIFFIPPFVFWLSGIRSEGPLLLCLAAAVYYTRRWFIKKSIYYFLTAMISLVGMFIFRPELLFVFLPAYISWTISIKNPAKTIQIFCVVYAVSLLIFFGSSLWSSTSGLPGLVISKQQQFFLLHGNTRFALDSLQPSPVRFLHVLPQAFANSFIRPFIWEAKGMLQILTALSVLASWLLFLVYLFLPDKTTSTEPGRAPLFHLLGWFAITQILLVGYIVPFPGAICRYNVIPQILLVVIITLQTNYNNKHIKIK